MRIGAANAVVHSPAARQQLPLDFSGVLSPKKHRLSSAVNQVSAVVACIPCALLCHESWRTERRLGAGCNAGVYMPSKHLCLKGWCMQLMLCACKSNCIMKLLQSDFYNTFL